MNTKKILPIVAGVQALLILFVMFLFSRTSMSSLHWITTAATLIVITANCPLMINQLINGINSKLAEYYFKYFTIAVWIGFFISLFF